MNTRLNFRIRLLLTGCHSRESDAPPHLEDLDLPDPACDSNLFAHIQSILSMHARDRLDQVFLAELKASEPNSPKNYINQPTAQRCSLRKKKVDGNFKHVPTNSEIRDSVPTLASLKDIASVYGGTIGSPLQRPWHQCGMESSMTSSSALEGFTKFTQLHVVTPQFVMVIPCALRARIEDRTGSRHDLVEVKFHLQLAIVLRIVVL